MGDWSFWGLLDALALARGPLIEGLAGAPFRPESASLASSYFQSELRLTAFGEAVLECREDNAALNEIDRWWGGSALMRRRSGLSRRPSLGDAVDGDQLSKQRL